MFMFTNLYYRSTSTSWDLLTAINEHKSTKNRLKMDPEVEPEFGNEKMGFPSICFQHFGATWSILVPFWRPSDFEGSRQIDHF